MQRSRMCPTLTHVSCSASWQQYTGDTLLSHVHGQPARVALRAWACMRAF